VYFYKNIKMKNFILITAVFCSMSASVLGQTLPSSIPTDSLLAFYTLNNSFIDVSGNGHTATTTGNVYPALGLNGFCGNTDSAFYFPNSWGTANRMNFPATLMAEMNNLTKGSITIHFKIDSLANHSHYFGFDNSLMIKQKHGSNSEMYLGIQDSKLRFHLTGSLPSTWLFVSNTTILEDQWYHAILTWDGQYEKMYINGVLDASISSSNTLSNMVNPSYFSIGALEGVGSPGSFSTIDNVGFWDDCLDSTEVSQMYAGFATAVYDSITQQPVSSTFTTSGGAYFTLAHSDTSATYQWQQNGGTGWSNLSDLGIYSGTMTDSLILTGISTSLNNYGFRCVVDACTMDTTDVAILTVIDDVGLDDNSLNSVVLSPNPNSGYFRIEVDQRHIGSTYRIVDFLGRTIEVGTITIPSQDFDLSDKPKGVYRIQFSNEKASKTLSVIIQ
jgi:hypothetical protein